MAASLLAMVCAITSGSKKHESDKPELEKLHASLSALRDALVSLAKDDADSYDKVMVANRTMRNDKSQKSAEQLQEALEGAASVPLKTASACADVLEKATRVAEIGITSASSDIGVAVLLAQTGFKGASMNVKINLDHIKDTAFVRRSRERLEEDENRAMVSARGALSSLSGLGQD